MQSVSSDSSAVNDGPRQEVFDTATRIIGARVTGFFREGEGEKATYHLEFKQKMCSLGSAHDLFDIDKVRANIFATVGVIIGEISDGEWWALLRALTEFRVDKS